MTTAPATTADGGPRVLVHRLDPGVPLPAYALPGDAGADIVTAVDVTLAPGERAVLPTGLAVALPSGFAAFVHPRSGLAARAGMGLVNAPGTIDSGYRGEIKVIVINHDVTRPLVLRRGERIAQLVVQRVEQASFLEVAELPGSERGAGGHGSTGGAGALARDSDAHDGQSIDRQSSVDPPGQQGAQPAVGSADALRTTAAGGPQ